MDNSVDARSMSLETWIGDSYIVKSIKDELNFREEVKDESTIGVGTVGTENCCKEKGGNGLSSVKEEPLCWDDTEEEDSFSVDRNDALLHFNHESNDNISIEKHEPCWNEEEAGVDTVVKEELFGDAGDMPGDISIKKEFLRYLEDIKQEQVVLDCDGVEVEVMRPQNEKNSMMNVDPLKGIDDDKYACPIKSYELQKHPNEPQNINSCSETLTSGDKAEKHILHDCGCKKPCKHSGLNEGTSSEQACEPHNKQSGCPRPHRYELRVKTTEKIPNLAAHLDYDCGQQHRYNCEPCGKSYKWKSNFVAHIKYECGKQEPHKCDSCGKSYLSWKVLRRHVKHNCSHQEPHKCEKCGKTYKLKQNFLIHMRYDCGRQEPHKCETCGKTYKAKQSLLAHVRYNCGRQEPYKCDKCGITFKHRSSIWSHIKYICNGQESQKSHRKFDKCKKCKKSFESGRAWQGHVCNPLGCGNCKKTFTCKRSLRAHLYHDCGREQPHKCDSCGKTFLVWRYLRRHVKYCCTDQEIYKCASCGKTYKWAHSLSAHVRYDCGRQEPFKCELCDDPVVAAAQVAQPSDRDSDQDVQQGSKEGHEPRARKKRRSGLSTEMVAVDVGDDPVVAAEQVAESSDPDLDESSDFAKVQAKPRGGARNRAHIFCELCGKGPFSNIYRHLRSVGHNLTSREATVSAAGHRERFFSNRSRVPWWLLKAAMGARHWRDQALRKNLIDFLGNVGRVVDFAAVVPVQHVAAGDSPDASSEEGSPAPGTELPGSTRGTTDEVAPPPGPSGDKRAEDATVARERGVAALATVGGATKKASTKAKMSACGLDAQVDHRLPLLASFKKLMRETASSGDAAKNYTAHVAKIMFACRPPTLTGQEDAAEWPQTPEEWVDLFTADARVTDYLGRIVETGAAHGSVLSYIKSYMKFVNYLATKFTAQEYAFKLDQARLAIRPMKARLMANYKATAANADIEGVDEVNAAHVVALVSSKARVEDLERALTNLEAAATPEGDRKRLSPGTAADMLVVRRNICFVAGPKKAMRPGVIQNMLVAEFCGARSKMERTGSKTMVVFVKRHKNAVKGKGSAGLYLDEEETSLFLRYFNLREKFYGPAEPDSPFVVDDAGKVTRVSQDITRIFATYLGIKYSCTMARKALATAGAELGIPEQQRCAAADAMAHSVQTAKAHYVVPTVASVRRNAEAVADIFDKKAKFELLSSQLNEEFPYEFPPDAATLTKRIRQTNRYQDVAIDSQLYAALKSQWENQKNK